MLRVLIVEDDSRAREFFRASVLACVRLELVGCVGSVAEALAVLQDPQAVPDILLVDLNLPDGLGLDVIRYASRHCPSAESLVISMFGDEDNVLAAIEAGALGYIHKDDTPENIAKTIVDMHAGASPISPMIARRVLSHFRTQRGQPTGLAPVPGPGPGPGPGPAPAPVPEAEPVAVERRAVPRAPKDSQVGSTAERPVLSSREQEVLELIARGFSYAEIARIKNISVHTVQTHIKGLYGKLSVHSKNEAVYEATRIGLL